jgi:error-prone DNA polymerase
VYIELHCSSAFSFLRGASLPETLINRAAALGYSSLALLDRDGAYGLPRFHQAAKAAGIRALIGAELTIAQPSFSEIYRPLPKSRNAITQSRNAITQSRNAITQSHYQIAQSPDAITQSLNAITQSPNVNHPIAQSPNAIAKSPNHPITQWILPTLVASPQGWQNLCRLITRMKLRAPKGEGALTLEDLEGFTAGLIALPGRPLLLADRYGVGGLLDRLIGVFGRGNVFVEIQRHLRRDQEDDNDTLVCLAEAFRVPVVATGGVRFSAPEERPLCDVLTTIREHTTLDAAGRLLAANAERYLKPPAQMARLFADRPEAVRESLALAERLEFTMKDLGYRFPKYPVPPGETEISFLRKIAEVGARDRYRPYHDRARAQVARELDLIEKLDLAGYFLIVWDIVNFCRQQDILVQGRGSAANSAVCYSLGITAVDPVGMDLLFERFLSEERGEWPDIDIDLPSGDRRERVIQHVYEKYGTHGAGMTANVITYRGRSAAREVGKALGLDPAVIDRLAKVMNQFEFVDPAETIGRNMAAAGLDAGSRRVQHFARLWYQMQDLPRHLGQHSGGMVICQGELSSVVPLENASMPGRVVVQWDKDDCTDMGLIKVDLLGLGMMAVLQDAIKLVNAEVPAAPSAPCTPHSHSAPRTPDSHSALRTSHAARLDLAHLPQDDPAVYRMLCAADTIGVFQVESRAQMATLPRLKPACFYDLVVQVAIIRPGPIVGQMVHPYLNRRAGREPVIYDHPRLEPVLARTLGVPLFQEQLLRMAMVVAGFSGGQAEELRRAMGFKRSEKKMQQIEVQLREGMAKHGITGEVADRIVLSITSFALYGFPESHAASFALLAYASAYLKTHFPAAFYTALLNNQPMGFYHPATLVKDAQRRGVRFAPIDVQVSDWDCTVTEDGTIRLGLRYVTGLREQVGKAMAATQSTVHGPRSTVHGPRSTVNRGAEPRTPDSELALRTSDSAPALRTPHPALRTSVTCPKCGCDDPSMIEQSDGCFCNVCSHQWTAQAPAQRRFASIDDLARRVGLRRDEITTLAEVGALNSFGMDRRSALWQVERVVRPAGELFEQEEEQSTVHSLRSTVKDSAEVPSIEGREAASLACPERAPASRRERPTRVEGSTGDQSDGGPWTVDRGPSTVDRRLWTVDRGPSASPLTPMTPSERLVADYAGTSLTIGPHPMSFRRHELSMRGVIPAIDLPNVRNGRRIRTAGMVITRQRPGTAKGFVFLTLEDETGVANIIVQPDFYEKERVTVVHSPFLIVEGILQTVDGVTAIKAERVFRLEGLSAESAIDSHDFH